MRLDPQRGMPMTKIGAADMLPRCDWRCRNASSNRSITKRAAMSCATFQGVGPCRKVRRGHQGVVLQPIAGLKGGERGLIGAALLQTRPSAK